MLKKQHPVTQLSPGRHISPVYNQGDVGGSVFFPRFSVGVDRILGLVRVGHPVGYWGALVGRSHGTGVGSCEVGDVVGCDDDGTSVGPAEGMPTHAFLKIPMSRHTVSSVHSPQLAFGHGRHSHTPRLLVPSLPW